MRGLLVVILAAAPAFAQPVPPASAAEEGPADVIARVRFERAVRAEFEGRRDDAVREAEACVAAEPEGRFAGAARDLIARLRSSPANATRSTGVGPRTELVITATGTGLYLSSWIAAAIDSGPKEAVAWIMAGTGGALVGSILATSGRRVPQSMPQMLENGIAYGSVAALLAEELVDNRGNIAGPVAAGASAGAVLALIASPWLTGGDSGAMTTSLLAGAGFPAAIAYLAANGDDRAIRWSALAGSTLGIVAGPLLNASAAWSRGRWNLITVGGGVGALFGAGIGVLADAKERPYVALLASGAAVGLGLTAWLTDGFDADEPRPGAASLIHIEDGRARAGNLMSAFAATGDGALLRVIAGRF